MTDTTKVVSASLPLLTSTTHPALVGCVVLTFTRMLLDCTSAPPPSGTSGYRQSAPPRTCSPGGASNAPDLTIS
jgi:hypothetical protein